MPPGGPLPAANSNIYESRIELPEKTCGHQAFVIISGLATLVAGIMLCAQIFMLVIMDSIISIDGLLAVYLMAFCVMFILAELGIGPFLKLLPSFNNWVYRGFLYSFVGVISGEMSKALLADLRPNSFAIPARIVSVLLGLTCYAMVVVGLLYMLMGICCLHGVWDAIKKGYDEEIDNMTEESSIHVK